MRHYFAILHFICCKNLYKMSIAKSSDPVFINKSAIKDILLNCDTFMFDCDGVLWRDNKVFSGTANMINFLRNKGKKVFFISNNSAHSCRQYLEKFSRFEIKTSEDEICPSAFAAAYYIKNLANVSGKVYVLGSSGMVEELDKQQISHVGYGPDDMVEGDWPNNLTCNLDPEVECVLHGFDPYYNYKKMKMAANYLAKPSVLFIATNKDVRVPSRDGFVHPGTGCMIIATETAAQRNATVVGKPESIIMDCIVSKHSIDPKRVCVIGDNIHTDIAFGNKYGGITILVLSGISTLMDVEKEKNDTTNTNNYKIPDYYIENVTKINELFEELDCNL